MDELANDQSNETKSTYPYTELKSGPNSVNVSDDSLDKSDFDDNTADVPESGKVQQRINRVLDVEKPETAEREAVVRNAKAMSTCVPNYNALSKMPIPGHLPETSKLSSFSILTSADQLKNITVQDTMSKENTMRTAEKVMNENQIFTQTPRKRNPYSIEEILKKDEVEIPYKRPKLTNVLQPCGIIVGKDFH